MSIKRTSVYVSDLPKIKKICLPSSLEIAQSSASRVTSGRDVEGDVEFVA